MATVKTSMSCTARCTLWLCFRCLSTGKDGTIAFETISSHPLAKHHSTFGKRLNNSKAPCSHWTSQFIIHTICYSCLRAVTAHGPRWSAGLVTTFAFMRYAGGRSGGILIEDSATGDSALHLHHFKYGMMLLWCGLFTQVVVVVVLSSCWRAAGSDALTTVVVQGTRVGESTIITVVILSSGLSLSILLWNGMSCGSTLKRHRGIHESLQPVPNVQYQYFLPADCYSSQRVNLHCSEISLWIS